MCKRLAQFLCFFLQGSSWLSSKNNNVYIETLEKRAHIHFLLLVPGQQLYPRQLCGCARQWPDGNKRRDPRGEECSLSRRWEQPTLLYIHATCSQAWMPYVMFFWWCILLTDLPVGRQDLLVLLKKLIKYIQIKVDKEKILVYCLNTHKSTRGFHSVLLSVL